MNKSIDFIGIGAQKSGTTWLYHRLNELSEFSMPPIKEFHYFNNNSNYKHKHLVKEDLLLNRLKNVNWTLKAIRSIVNSFLQHDNQRTKWMINYYFSDFSNEWYLSQFLFAQGITGEITPAYAILNEDDIKKMHNLIPEAKLIFLLRNPIDRVWSQYRHHCKKNKINPKNEEHFFIFTEGKLMTLKKSNYLKSINNYTKHYDKTQILIGFYDAIQKQPLALLTGIVDFMEGDSSKIAKECSLFRKENVSPKLQMPKNISDFLKDKLHSQMKQLSEAFGGYCTDWYNGFDNQDKIVTDKPTSNPSYLLLK